MIFWDIAPTAEMVIAIGQLNGAGAVKTFGVDIGTASKERIDEIELASHRGPMNGLVTPRVPGVKEGGMFIDQFQDACNVSSTSGRSDSFALRRSVLGSSVRAEKLLHF